MRRLLLLILLTTLTAQAPAQTIFPGKAGAELRKSLREDYTPNSYLDYTPARALMFGTIDNNGGRVELAYTSETFPINPSSPIPDPDVVNTEHTWPQSKFSHDRGKGMRTDLHHLFPSRNPVNAARGNRPFGEIDDDIPHSWWNGPSPQATKPAASEIARFSEGTIARFEPEEDPKGDVARAMIYFYTIYEENPKVVKSFLPPQLAALKAWHAQDGATPTEIDRTKRIEQVQGNVNPFVIDPTLLERAVSDIVTTVGPLVDADDDDSSTSVGPSPIPGSGTADAIGGVQIAALLPNPIGADEGKETVTLANPTEAEISLAGWKLTDKADREFPLTGKIAPGEMVTFKLANTMMVLGNNGGEVNLFNASGAKHQTVSYTKQQARSGTFVLFGN